MEDIIREPVELIDEDLDEVAGGGGSRFTQIGGNNFSNNQTGDNNQNGSGNQSTGIFNEYIIPI